MLYFVLGFSALICFFSPRLVTFSLATGAIVALAMLGSNESWLGSGLRALLVVGIVNLVSTLIGRLIWRRLIGQHAFSDTKRDEA